MISEDSADTTLYVVNPSPTSCDGDQMADALRIRCRRYLSVGQLFKSLASPNRGCVLVDLERDESGGVAIVRELRLRNQFLPVIVQCAFPDVRSTVLALRGGVFSVVRKSCGNDNLMDEIRMALDQNRALQAAAEIQADIESRFKNLDNRELEVMELVLAGIPNKSITNRLDISLRTLNRIRGEILRKTASKTVLELAQIAAKRSRTHNVA